MLKKLYKLLKPFLASILELIWIGEIKGIINIPKVGRAIIASNHTSYFDFFIISFIGYRIKRDICFLAAKEVLALPFLKLFLRFDKQIQGIGFDRNNPGIDYFRKALQYLKEKKIIALFPEGTRSSDGKLGRAKIGFIKLALESKTSIVPMGIQGTFEVLPKYKKIPKIKKCNVSIGKPINLSAYYNQDLQREDFQKIADDIMREVETLLEL